MSDDMVEQVAKAIYESGTARPYKWRWKELDRFQEPYRRIARDVIAAMREPTEAMIKAHAHPIEPNNWGPGIRANWQSMIDAALAKQS